MSATRSCATRSWCTPPPAGLGGGPELAEFLTLVEAFNRRPERPTRWQTVVRTDADPLARLLKDRPGDVAILAGRNDRKMALARQLHDAGLHVLADKPWLTSAAALPDVRHVLSGGARVMEMMTGRHAATSSVANRLVGDRDIFGAFATGDDAPAIRLASVHHLEKVVNGAPLRRPAWYFDVRVQGDGLADIPTHLVDQAQRFVATHGVATDTGLELVAARRWSTPVPRALFARVTGVGDFPAEVRGDVDGDVLAYAGNAELAFRLGGIGAHLAHPVGSHGASRRGRRPQRDDHRHRCARAHRAGPSDRLPAAALGGAARERSAARGGAEPGRHRVAIGAPRARGRGRRRMDSRSGSPRAPGTAHEAQFPLVLDEFLRSLDRGPWPDSRAAETLAKYELLGRARVVVHDGPPA